MATRSTEEDVQTIADSTHFLSDGKRKMMRIFVSYEEDRSAMDIPQGRSIAYVKQLIQKRFFIHPNRAQLGDENLEKNTLILSYAGSELQDHWILSDLGISPGATLRAYIKEELDPVFHFYVGYNQETISILDRLKIRDFSVATLRGMASRKTGLPVGVFRLVTKDNVELFDCHTLDEYNVRPGDVIRVETWDGWSDLLSLAALGFTSHVVNKLANMDEILCRFQMKVALYMAAHFGHVDLAVTMTKAGVRADEPVGEHPLRQWNQLDRHVDLKKAPVHEAVEAGQLSVLRTFVHHSVCCIMARDGNGLQPLNIALRNKMKACASFLLTKQWSRIPYTSTSIPLAIYARMKAWTDRAKDKSQVQGMDKSSKKRNVRENPLVGQGVYVHGFSEAQLSSRAKPNPRPDRNNWAIEEYYRNLFNDDPEDYFRTMLGQKERTSRVTYMRQSRLGGAATPQKQSDASNSGDSPENDRRGTLPSIQHGRSGQRRSRTEQGVKWRQSTAGEDSGMSRPSSGHSPDTGKRRSETGQGQGQDQSEKANRKKSISKSLLAKAKATEGLIPLPLNSVNDTPRPYFFIRPGQEDMAADTLDKYEYYRGMKSRDYAIRCLAVANSFREKPWLHQVRMAMNFSALGIKKSVKKRGPSMFHPAEGDVGTG